MPVSSKSPNSRTEATPEDLEQAWYEELAKLQAVPVLNVNELAAALKPVYLPGEDTSVTIVKEGKEPGQGVAYLEDGTMVVVENGHKYIGKTIDISVTKVLQTAAGRMIFAKPDRD